MSSYLRNMQRKFRRNNPDPEAEPRAQPIRNVSVDGYETLRPTKGWIKITTRRLIAQHKMRQMRGF